MKKPFNVAFAVLGVAFLLSLFYTGEKIGKVFIRTSSTMVDGLPLVDQELEDSVKDMKKKANKFVVVDSEKEADYLLVVTERNRVDNKSELRATLSSKENGQWKAATRLTTSDAHMSWTFAAERIMKGAAEWVEARGK